MQSPGPYLPFVYHAMVARAKSDEITTVIMSPVLVNVMNVYNILGK